MNTINIIQFEAFKKARVSKFLTSVIFNYTNDKKCSIILWLKTENKITGLSDEFSINLDFENIYYSSYKNQITGKPLDLANVQRICFYISVWPQNNGLYNNHILTALKEIKQTSNLEFIVKAFNNTDNDIKQGTVKHSITLRIDNKFYLINEFCGPDNLASPIRY